MNIRHEDHGDVCVLHLDGKLDMDGMRLLKNSLQNERQNGKKKIVLNFKEIIALQSTVLKELMTPMRAITYTHGLVGICGMSPGVHKILKTAHFYPTFKVYDTVEDAVKEMKTL